MNMPIDRPRRRALPPLENGDHLTREEFERRYDAMPWLKKAELINGVVYMPSPVSQTYHSNPHFNLIAWLGTYVAATPGVQGGDNGSIRLDNDNEPQPDAFLRILPTHGGQAQLDADGYVTGAPELVCEVAGSSASYDLHVKLDLYRKNQAREYLVWPVYDEAVDWFLLEGQEYRPLALSGSFFESRVFPGLRLDVPALIECDLTRVLQSLQAGLGDSAHRAFVQELQVRGNKR